MKLLGKSFAVAAMALAVSTAAEARFQTIGDTTADGSELLLNVVNYDAQKSYTLDLGVTIAQFRANSGQSMDLWSSVLNSDSNFQSFLAAYNPSHNVTWGISGGHQVLDQYSDLELFGFYTTSAVGTPAPSQVDNNSGDISNTQGVWSALVSDINTIDSNANNLSTFRSVGELGYTAPYGDDFGTALPFKAQGSIGEELAFVHERVNAENFIASEGSVDIGEVGTFAGKWKFNIANGAADLKYSVSPVSQVPVPAAVWMFGTGLLGLLGLNRRKAA